MPLTSRAAPADLDKPSAFVERMKKKIERAQALLGGTDAMRAAGETYLPKFPGESQATYDWRLKVATLNNFYKTMLEQMVGLMFSRGFTIEKSSIPPDFLKNIDQRGASVQDFAMQLAKALLSKGRPHILIDHPKKPEGAETLADDQAHGLRPYWVLMEPEPLFFAHAQNEGGIERLQQIRWREDGGELKDYSVETRQRLRVMKRAGNVVTFELWERSRETENWQFKDEGLVSDSKSALKDIPFVTLYADRQAFMVSSPTLDDVAEKNVEHWQSSADQRHILTVTRFPFLKQIGTQEPVALIGPYSMFHSTATKDEVEVDFVEATGHGIKHGLEDLARIVSEAEAMAVRIITSDAAKTESGEQIDFQKEGAPLQRLAGEVEKGLNEALKFTAIWCGLDPAAGGTCAINKDFALSRDEAEAIKQLIELRKNGDLSRPTLWEELKARGLFKKPFSAAKEQANIESEEDAAMARQAEAFANDPANDDEPDNEPAAAGGGD